MKADPNSYLASSKVFQNIHNPGQVTTGHRSVEEARLKISKTGPHQEAGAFERVYSDEPWKPYDPEAPKKYVAPSGDTVTITEPDSMKPLPPADKVVVVTDASGEHKFSESAAKLYLSQKYSIGI